MSARGQGRGARHFGVMALLALLGPPALGCSAILGIKDLPGPDGGGDDSGEPSSGSASGSGSGSTSGSGSGSGSGSASGSGSRSGSASGSGASSGSSTDPLAAFLGTWEISGGTQTLSSCTFADNDGTITVPTTVQLVWVRGTTSDIVGTYQGAGSSGCSVEANVNGNVATAVIPQPPCTEVAQDGEVDSITLQSSTFTISGSTAHEVLEALDSDTTTGPATCEISGDSTLTKL